MEEEKEQHKNPIAVNKKYAFIILGAALLVLILIGLVIIPRRFQ